MTSSWCLKDELDRRCGPEMKHEHVPLMEGRAAAAQVYPKPLCTAICKGVARQKAYDMIDKRQSKVLEARRLSSIVESICGTKPRGEWPNRYVDIAHEKDGRSDKFGERLQDGVSILDNMLAGLSMKYGVLPMAWDDVNEGNALIPEKVIEARKLEMQYFARR